MKKVAREARVSQGILHYYYADKRAILVAALETVTADLDRRVASPRRAAGGRAGAAPGAVGACMRLAVEERAFWIVFVEFWGEMMHDRRLREINAALYARMRRQIGAVVAHGIRAGVFRRVDVLRAAAVILGSSTASRSSSRSTPRVPRRRRDAFCGEAVLRYLAKEAS
jgi:AcrR family transcriptional regulator